MRVYASSLLLVVLMPPAVPALSSKTLAAPRRSTTSAQEAVSLAFVFHYVQAILTTGHCTAGLSRYATPPSADGVACCALCAADSRCVAWTFHNGSRSKTASGGTCYLSDHADCRPVPGASGGCDPAHPSCQGADPHRCEPVQRPPAPKLAPLPTGIKTAPHLISILVDDLGFVRFPVHLTVPVRSALHRILMTTALCVASGRSTVARPQAWRAVFLTHRRQLGEGWDLTQPPPHLHVVLSYSKKLHHRPIHCAHYRRAGGN